ncbi:conserved hypothetical protein, partial [Ricinus communis]
MATCTSHIASIVTASVFCTCAVLIAGCGGGGSAAPAVDRTASTMASAPAISIKANQKIAGFLNDIDMYVPSNAEMAVIFLHGGGGHKENFA